MKELNSSRRREKIKDYKTSAGVSDELDKM
jgi:hypothetical protein